MGSCMQETVVLLIRFRHAFSPNMVGNRVRPPWKCIHPARGRTPRVIAVSRCGKNGITATLTLSTTHLDLWAQIGDLARHRRCATHRAVKPEQPHLPAGSGGNPGTAWLVRSTDAWARPMPLAVSVMVACTGFTG
jgi:hypothetical protein